MIKFIGPKKLQVFTLLKAPIVYCKLRKDYGVQQITQAYGKKVWCLKAPSKALNLLRRAVSGCLPTFVMLQQKHVEVLGTCPVLEGENETIFHSLVSCPFASQCWWQVQAGIVINVGDNFETWLKRTLNSCSGSKGCEVAMLCWAIWKARNDKVWRKSKFQVNNVCTSALQYLIQWRSVQSKSFTAISQTYREGDCANVWVKSKGDTIKVTVDGAFTEHSTFGIGVVARKSDGELVQAFSKIFQEDVAPELSETIAIRDALSWLKDK